MQAEALSRTAREEAEKLRTGQRKADRRHVFVTGRPAKSRSLTFRLTTDDFERLEQLRDATDANSMSQLLLRALGTYDLLVEYIGRGYELEFKSPSNYCSQEELEEVEQQLVRLIGSGGRAAK